MSLKINDKELNSILDEVVLELNKSFGAVKEKLAKSEESKEESKQMEKALPPAEDKAPVASEESSPVADEASESAPAPAPDAAPAAPDMGGDAAAPGQDPAQDMQLTPEALQAEYAKLPPEELQMHMQACQAALAALSGGMPSDAGAPPAPEAAPAPDMAPPAAAPAMAMKSEKASNDLKKSIQDAVALAKAEANAELASLKEDVEILTKSLKTVLEAPSRKAITSIAELPKTEQEEVKKSISVDDFWGKLKEVAKRPDLKKSDKQLIRDIYDRRVQPAVAAKHLAKLFSEE